MKTLKEVENKLAKLGHFNRYFARAEVRELPNILSDDEEIIAVVTGRYHNGFALLVATSYRLLLIDKKPFFLNMEDTRYDMISEVDFITQLIDAVVSVRTINKTLTFKSIRKRKLREITTLIQQKVMELRQNQQDMQNTMFEQQPAQPAQQFVPMPDPNHFAAGGTMQVPNPQPDPVSYQAPTYVSPEQSATVLGAVALNQRPRGIRRFSPIPSQPLTVRGPTSSLYGSTHPRS